MILAAFYDLRAAVGRLIGFECGLDFFVIDTEILSYANGCCGIFEVVFAYKSCLNNAILPFHAEVGVAFAWGYRIVGSAMAAVADTLLLR